MENLINTNNTNVPYIILQKIMKHVTRFCTISNLTKMSLFTSIFITLYKLKYRQYKHGEKNGRSSHVDGFNTLLILTSDVLN